MSIALRCSCGYITRGVELDGGHAWTGAGVELGFKCTCCNGKRGPVMRCRACGLYSCALCRVDGEAATAGNCADRGPPETVTCEGCGTEHELRRAPSVDPAEFGPLSDGELDAFARAGSDHR